MKKGTKNVKEKSSKNKDRVPTDWMEKALLEFGIDEKAEKEKISKRASDFKNN